MSNLMLVVQLDRLRLENKQLKARIKHLEDRIERASIAFFADGSDRQTAAGMLQILEEERNKP